MTSARIRFEVSFSRGAESEDFPEIREFHPMCEPSLFEAMADIQARRDEQDPKTGRLAGSFSTSFLAHPNARRASGRIVYTVEGACITIIAAYPEHNEAYKRARARYKLKTKVKVKRKR